MWNKYSAKQVTFITLCKDNTDLGFSFYIFLKAGASQMQKRLKFNYSALIHTHACKIRISQAPLQRQVHNLFSAIMEMCISLPWHWTTWGMWYLKCPLIPTANWRSQSEKESLMGSTNCFSYYCYYWTMLRLLLWFDSTKGQETVFVHL